MLGAGKVDVPIGLSGPFRRCLTRQRRPFAVGLGDRDDRLYSERLDLIACLWQQGGGAVSLLVALREVGQDSVYLLFVQLAAWYRHFEGLTLPLIADLGEALK